MTVKKISKEDIKKINTNYDKIISDFDKTADSVEPMMPLVAQSIRLTISLVKTYKKAFNATATKQ